MSVEVETGRIALVDGAVIPWTRQELSPDEADLFRAQARLQTYLVTTVAEKRGGGLVVSKYDVPGTWLEDFLLGDTWNLAKVPGEHRKILTVEPLGGSEEREE